MFDYQNRLLRRLALTLMLLGAVALCAFSLSSSAHTNTVSDVPTVFVRQFSLTTKDLIYDSHTQMIYASVPSTVGSQGNSLTPINPVTGALGTPVFVGSEPGKLAISDDGQYIYAALDGAGAVRRFNVAAQSAELQFGVGRLSDTGPYFVNDMDVLPGNPHSVAISRKFIGVSPDHAGVAIYDDGVPRPTETNRLNSHVNQIEFSASASTLYGQETDGTTRFFKLAVNGSGVSVTSEMLSSLFFQGTHLEVANGLLYTEYGNVVNMETQTVVGTFAGVAPTSGTTVMKTDAANGRIYFLTGSGATLTLRAFDLNTYQPVGSVDINGVSGTPGSLIRWGANGLAFRTSANQLFLLQTSLVPSNEPVPEPTPTPSATPTPTPTPTPELFTRQLALPANDIVLENNTQTLYVSVPSRAGAQGNTITAINPANGALGTSVFVGSEPGKLALADDGHTLYMSLDGAAAVRRYDLATQTPGQQFSPGYRADDMAVLPGNPDALAISRWEGSSFNQTIAVYDNGVRRQSMTGNLNNRPLLAFGANSARLYASNGGWLMRMNVDAAGVTALDNTIVSGNGDIKFLNGLLYQASGRVFDAETGALRGLYSIPNVDPNSTLVLPDAAAGRVYFLTASGGPVTLRAFDMQTFRPIGSVAIGFFNLPQNMVRWGANGLAFSTANQVVIIQTSLIPSGAPVPTPTPTPTPTPSPSPTPAPTVRSVTVTNKDIVYDQPRELLYASVPSTSGSNANTIISVNPTTGALGAPVPIGDEPNQLALSENGQYLYVGLDGAARGVKQLNLTTQAQGPVFPLGIDINGAQATATDLKGVPGHPESVAVSKRSFSYSEGVGIYDNGVQRPVTVPNNYPTNPFPIVFSSPSTLFGSSSNGMLEMGVNESGVSVLGTTNPSGGFELRFANGRLYTEAGAVVDAATKSILGRFVFSNPSSSDDFGLTVCPDPAKGRIYFITGNGPYVLRAYDLNTFRPLGRINLSGITLGTGTLNGLVRWGANGLAFRTSDRIYLIRTALIPSHGTPGDFDGDQKTDLGVFRPASGTWYVSQSSNGAFRGVPFGLETDRPVTGDYDGDGKADIAVWRPSSGAWYILQSSNNVVRGLSFGATDDVPVQGDYDGDGKTDVAVFRPSNGYWYILQSSDGSFNAKQFGLSSDRAVPGDYDGDGKFDVAVFRPGTGNWYVLRSTDSALASYLFGQSDDRPVQGDYDGDGLTDVAVFRPTLGNWYILQSTSGFKGVAFGTNGDTPVPGDYDGDGKADVAVFRPGQGYWYILQSSDGAFLPRQFGASGDLPAPASYIPN